MSGEGSARAPWLGITPRGGDRRASSNNTLQLRDDSNATGGGEWLERIHFIASTTLSDQVLPLCLQCAEACTYMAYE